MKSDRVATYFYIVVNEKFPTTVTYKHDTMEGAAKEAERLAKCNPGQTFVVMESVTAYLVETPIQVIEYVSAHNNPDDPEYIPF
jgi:hypothetical protein